MTEEIEAALREYRPPIRTRAGVPWAYVSKINGGVAVYVWREANRCIPERTLQEMFGLTPQQARAAQLVFGRRTNHEISRILAVSLHTARRHVEAMLSKLGAESRFDVEEILSLAAIRHMRVAHEGE